MGNMAEALDILVWGLLKVFAVLATIFVGIKFLHWFTPEEERAPAVRKPVSAAAPITPAVVGRPAVLSNEEISAIRIALFNATGGKGTLGKIVEVNEQ